LRHCGAFAQGSNDGFSAYCVTLSGLHQVIDGSHEFQPTLSDLTYSRLLARPGSLLLVDDVIENKAPGELWRLVLEAGMAEEVSRVSCEGHPLAIAKWK
jgi:hypothetical protein